MTETVKLYDADAYATEFEALVLACEEKEWNKQKAYEVILDQTLFFPEEGGQTPDRGSLGGAKVLDVQIKEDVIYHILSLPLSQGEKVAGKIDWQHRFSNMQQHSGEHIFSGLVHSRFGYDNVGFHLSDNIVTMDFNGVLTKEDVEQLELSVNQVIAKNLSIQAEYPDKAVLEQLEYRSKIEIAGAVRIVTIDGVDVCACCAPHVKQTGEIGMFKVISVQSHRGGVRISFFCGYRALEDYKNKSNILSEMISLLSEPQENILEAVTKLKESNQDLKYEIGSMKRKIMADKVAAVPKEQEHVMFFEDDLDALVMRETVNQLTQKHQGFCGIFAGTDKEGYRFVIGSSQKDCKVLLDDFRKEVEVRGGGSPVMVQGTMMGERKQLEKVLESL